MWWGELAALGVGPQWLVLRGPRSPRGLPWALQRVPRGTGPKSPAAITCSPGSTSLGCPPHPPLTVHPRISPSTPCAPGLPALRGAGGSVRPRREHRRQCWVWAGCRRWQPASQEGRDTAVREGQQGRRVGPLPTVEKPPTPCARDTAGQPCPCPSPSAARALWAVRA